MRALYRGGYNPGPIDGIIGRQTMADCQRLPERLQPDSADYLIIETVRALDTNY